MKRTYTGVGYGRTNEEAERNARHDAQDQADDDQIMYASAAFAFGILRFAFSIITGYARAFMLFAQGFFFAPLPSLVSSALCLVPPLGVFYLFALGAQSGTRPGEAFVNYALGFVISSFMVAPLHQFAFLPIARAVLEAECSILRRFHHIRVPLTLLSVFLPVLVLLATLFSILGFGEFVVSISRGEGLAILLLLFFLVMQVGAIVSRTDSYREAGDFTWYGAAKSQPANEVPTELATDDAE